MPIFSPSSLVSAKLSPLRLCRNNESPLLPRQREAVPASAAEIMSLLSSLVSAKLFPLRLCRNNESPLLPRQREAVPASALPK
ncbi:MAG: hypothetical protein HDS62_01300 [Bacteroidales bacterium]|nr:hypothetical protein [Bacteroidales bacterium]